MAGTSTKMSREQREEFFDNLEQGLKEDYTIPKKKVAEATAEPSPETEVIESPLEKAKESGYSKKPPGAVKMEKRSAQKRKRDLISDREGAKKVKDPPEVYAGRKSDPSGLNTFQEMFDRPLPKELLEMCVASKCSLCEAQFTSNIVAKTHYLGKSHAKKVNSFLQSWALKTKNPKPAKLSEFSATEGYRGENFCKVCNTPLSSKIVAVAHYQGKRHSAAVRNAGKFNPAPAASQDGHFGIGEAFRVVKPLEKPEDLKDGEVFDQDWSEAPESSLSREGDARRSFCLPCKMYFSSEEYSAHVAGDEHKSKALSQMGSEKDGRKYYCYVCMVQCDAGQTYDAHLQSVGHRSKVKDASDAGTDSLLSKLRADPLSIYRCGVCDLQCTGQRDYEVHVAGRKHRLKAGLPALPTQGNPCQLSDFRCEICNITTTDQSGLDMHFSGKKHKKKASQVSQSFLNSF